VLYADDISLIALSISELQRLIHNCEKELARINVTKSCCLRTGQRFDAARTQVSTADGHKLPWVNEIRYLGTYMGTYIVAGRQHKCSIDNAKRAFHRSLNAIFGEKMGMYM